MLCTDKPRTMDLELLLSIVLKDLENIKSRFLKASNLELLQIKEIRLMLSITMPEITLLVHSARS